jgi:hypothetical protein
MSATSGNGRNRAIFISYRRDDSEGESGRLYDDLVRAYGDSSVFMDVSGIQPGIDFREAIDDNVAACGVLLGVIGSTWATITGHDGIRRLDNPEDYVRLEIASALKRGIPVIPVLVHGAHMPALEQLPDDLKDLCYRNSVELTHARWSSDVALFIAALKSYVDAKPAHPEATVHATVPVQLPAPQQTPPAPAQKSRAPLFVGLGIAVAAVLAVAGFLVFRNKPVPEPPHPAAPIAISAPANVTPASTGAAPSSAHSVSSAVTVSASSATAPASPSHTAASVSSPVPLSMIGEWKLGHNNLPLTDPLQQLNIAEFGGQFSVHAYGSCPGTPCDWGTRTLVMKNGFAVTTEPWEPRNTDTEKSTQRRVTVSMAVNGNALLVTAKNQVVDPVKGQAYSLHDVQMRKVN